MADQHDARYMNESGSRRSRLRRCMGLYMSPSLCVTLRAVCGDERTRKWRRVSSQSRRRTKHNATKTRAKSEHGVGTSFTHCSCTETKKQLAAGWGERFDNGGLLAWSSPKKRARPRTKKTKKLRRTWTRDRRNKSSDRRTKAKAGASNCSSSKMADLGCCCC